MTVLCLSDKKINRTNLTLFTIKLVVCYNRYTHRTLMDLI